LIIHSIYISNLDFEVSMARTAKTSASTEKTKFEGAIWQRCVNIPLR
jgi:hypothetical protein